MTEIKDDRKEDSKPVLETAETEKESPSFMLVVFLVLPLAGIFIALLMVAANPPEQQRTVTMPRSEPASLINYAAPDFELTDMTGNPIRLSDYKGQRLLLNFWYRNCPPCVQEIPAFSDFVEMQGNDGVAVLAINVEDGPQVIASFFDELGVYIPVALDRSAEVSRLYGIQGYPTTFAIDGDGIVRHMKLGAMTIQEMFAYTDDL